MYFTTPMKLLSLLLVLGSTLAFSQEKVEAILIREDSISSQKIIKVDNFGTTYSVDNTTFYLTKKEQTINYSNLQLGTITTANAFNPMQINVFYNTYNTVVILDNRLAEIYVIPFNTLANYKNVSHVTTGNDNSLWIYRIDTQQLELYDYKKNKTRATTLPILAEVLDLKSNYNYCWVLTDTYLYKYNYFGRLEQKIENEGFTNLEVDNGVVFLQKKNKVFYLFPSASEYKEIQLPNLLINRFLVTNETLYIYSHDLEYKYQLKKN